MTESMSSAPSATSVPVAGRRRARQLRLVEDRAGAVVKWAGGKGRLVDRILQEIPATFARYHEPFLGGGSVFFALASLGRVASGASLSDANADLIELYLELAADPVGLHREVSELCGRHREVGPAAYYAARAAWNVDRSQWTRARRAAVCLYLNRACFNGLFRTNKAGHLNTPVGRGPGLADWPVAPSLSRLAAASAALSSVDLSTSDFRVSLGKVSPGDLVYLDPPYLPRSPSASFRSYVPGGFGSGDHGEMAALAVNLAASGATVVVSSSDVPGARELYPGFRCVEVTAQRAISASEAGRARVSELIFVGGEGSRG